MSDDLPETFTLPEKASHHCRFYSYVRADQPDIEQGPTCARGISLAEPGAARKCMPEHDGTCAFRAEYTDDERQAWKEATEGSMMRLIAGIGALALAGPIPVGDTRKVKCPSCRHGEVHATRTSRGAIVGCDTHLCCGAFLSLDKGDWPPKVDAQ